MRKKVLAFCLAIAAASVLGLGASVSGAGEAAVQTISPLAHYEFLDPAAPGKDSMGNFDLTERDCKNQTGGEIVVENGVAAFDGKKVLYAKPIKGAQDFSDYMTAFTYACYVSTNVTEGTVFAGGGGWRGGGLSIEMKKTNIWVRAGANGSTFMEAGGLDLSTLTHVAITADREQGTAALYVGGKLVQSKEGLQPDDIFMSFDPDTYFAVGGEVHRADDTSPFIGSLKDVRVYDFAVPASAIGELALGNEIPAEGFTGKTVKSIETVVSPGRVSGNAGAEEIALTLPDKVQVTFSSGNAGSYYVIWKKDTLQKNEESCEFGMTGLVLCGAANVEELVAQARIPYAEDTYIKPVTWYFTDSDYAQDRRGNFHLTEMNAAGTAGGKLEFQEDKLVFDGKRVLYSAPVSGALDFTDYLTDYSVAFYIQPTAGVGVALSAGWYGGMLVECGVVEGKGKIFVRAGDDTTFMEGTFDSSVMTHVVISADKKNGRTALYINGALAGEKTTGSENIFIGLNETLLAFGARVQNKGTQLNTDAPFTGALRDVRLYDHALDVYAAKNIAQDTAMSENGTAAMLENAFVEINIDTENIDLVVAEGNTEADIAGNLSAAVVAGGKAASALWYKVENGTVFGLVYGAEGINEGGLTARVALQYALAASGQGIVSFEKQTAGYGDTVSFTVTVPPYSELVKVAADGAELTPDGSGNYTFVYAGQQIAAEIAYLLQSVDYRTNGGTLPEGVATTYTADKGIVLAVPAKEGFLFEGWFATEDFSGEPVVSIAPGEGGDRVYYAKWTKSSTVAYHTNGGTLPEDAKTVVRENEQYNLPVPVWSGHTFEGWFTDPEFAGNSIERLEWLTADIALYAKWSVDRYTITFETGGGSKIAQQVIEYGGEIAVPEDPVREGYRFVGWYADEEGTAEFSLYNPVEGSVTVYAKWEKVSAAKKGGCGSKGSASAAAGIPLLTLAAAAVIKRRLK